MTYLFIYVLKNNNMAAAAHFTARIYGEVHGSAPFQDANGATSFDRTIPWATATVSSLPTTGTQFYTLPNGALVGSSYVYSVIEVQPTGLNVHSKKYVTEVSVATLATLAG